MAGGGRIPLHALTENEGSPTEPLAFDWQDLFDPWRHWRLSPSTEPERERASILDLLLPPLSQETVERVVYSSGWPERLAAATTLAANPAAVAGTISTGLIMGQDHREIAKQLEPLVQNVEASARRIARTECLRVAGQAQEATHEKYLGPLIIGWQVRASLDKNTRPWHAKRDKRKYYLEPGPGQDGMDKCPHPPEEAVDPNERPPKTPFVAPNCRCFLVPLLRA